MIEISVWCVPVGFLFVCFLMKLTHTALLVKCWGVCSWFEEKTTTALQCLLPLTSPLTSTRSWRDMLRQRLTSKRNVERTAATEKDQSSSFPQTFLGTLSMRLGIPKQSGHRAERCPPAPNEQRPEAEEGELAVSTHR